MNLRVLAVLVLCSCSAPPVIVATVDAGSGDAGTNGGFTDSGTSDAGVDADAGTDAGLIGDAGVDAGSPDAGPMYRDAGPVPDAGACLLNTPESVCGTRECCQTTDECLRVGTTCSNGDVAIRCRYGSDCGIGLKCFLSGLKAACSINGPANSEQLCNPVPPTDGGTVDCPPSAPNCVRAAGLLHACRP